MKGNSVKTVVSVRILVRDKGGEDKYCGRMFWLVKTVVRVLVRDKGGEDKYCGRSFG
jgi:hypothetical protein